MPRDFSGLALVETAWQLVWFRVFAFNHHVLAENDTGGTLRLPQKRPTPRGMGRMF
jgi:hypothetical protein